MFTPGSTEQTALAELSSTLSTMQTDLEQKIRTAPDAHSLVLTVLFIVSIINWRRRHIDIHEQIKRVH